MSAGLSDWKVDVCWFVVASGLETAGFQGWESGDLEVM